MGSTTLSGTPAFLGSSSISYSAKDVRRFMTSAPIIYTAGGEGIVESGDFAVTQRGAGANMSVDVAAGEAYVKGDTSADEGSYYVREASTLNVTVDAADATNPRIDRVVLEIKNDSEDGSGLNLARIRTINGTPTVGATLTNLTGAAAVPSTCLLLANIVVAASDTSILTAEIQDRRFGVPIAGRALFGGVTTSTVAVGPTAAAVDVINHTIIGDGLTAVQVDFFAPAFITTGGATIDQGLTIRDASSGGGTAYAAVSLTSPGVGYKVHAQVECRMAAFSGSRAIYVRATTGSGNVTVNAGAGTPMLLRSAWAV